LPFIITGLQPNLKGSDLVIKLKETNLNLLIMGNLLYVVAVILIIAWAIGFIGYSIGGVIHILLVIALIAIILRVIQGKKIL
jgi:hypothetical protein